MCGNLRAKILSYDAVHRTARVHIYGKTDGASNGLEATFAYPVGDNDLDTEREILADTEVYVFFEAGDEARPVIWAFSSHGEGAAVDVRRIRQENIEVLARNNMVIEGKTVSIHGATHVNIIGAGGVSVESDTKVSVRAPVISLNGA